MFCLSVFKYFYEVLYFNRTMRVCAMTALYLFNQVEPAEPLNIALRGALFIKNIHTKDEIKSNYVCLYGH